MFDKQFVLAKEATRVPNRYEMTEIGGWFLGSAPDLETIKIDLPAGRKAVVCGHPVDTEGATTQFGDTGRISDLYGLSGSWMAIVEAQDGVRVFLDAGGMMPVVYAPDEQVLASTPALIHERDYSVELAKAFPIENDAFFPFGLTPKDGVFRLLPNHSLLLRDWSVERHWRIGDLRRDGSPDKHIAAIEARLSAIVASLSQAHDLIVPLTAGYDSRSILSVAAGAQNVRSFTTTISEAAQYDAQIAAKLASIAGVPHERATSVPASAIEREEWLDSTGRCVGGGISFAFKASDEIVAGAVELPGMAGEVGRAFYHGNAKSSDSVDAKLILGKLGLPESEIALTAAADWLAGIGSADAHDIFDLLYIEIRLGCWAAPQQIATGSCKFRISPFSDRRIFDHALQIPLKMRAANYIPAQVVSRRRPDLAKLPYNRRKGTLVRKVRGKLRRTVTALRQRYSPI